MAKPEPVSGECYNCGGSFRKGAAVLVHKKYADAAAFHDICRGPHRDYVTITWPPIRKEKDPARSEST